MAEAVLRAGLALLTVVAATDCLFALAAGAGVLAAIEGIILTGLGLAAVLRTDRAVSLLRPRGRVVLLAALFAVGGLLDVGLQTHYGEVAVAIACIAALICAARWVLLCWTVSVAGFIAALASHGSSLAWMVGDGRYVVAGQLVNLGANAFLGLLMVALLRGFLANAPRHLEELRAGGPSLTPQLALRAGGRDMALLPAADARTVIAGLTQAERAVLVLLAGGRAPKQAARELEIPLLTARSRIASAKRRTGARTLEQLVALYVKADVD